MNEFYEIANFMNTWSQQQQEELHESFVNRLYECKPVKSTNRSLHFVLLMLAPQQYAYLWKAQIKTSPKIGWPPKIMAFRGRCRPLKALSSDE